MARQANTQMSAAQIVARIPKQQGDNKTLPTQLRDLGLIAGVIGCSAAVAYFNRAAHGKASKRVEAYVKAAMLAITQQDERVATGDIPAPEKYAAQYFQLSAYMLPVAKKLGYAKAVEAIEYRIEELEGKVKQAA